MKYSPAIAFLAISAFGQPALRTVYVLPMAGGLDQYLAEWLTRDHVMQVVTDPKIADVVLTDRLGEAFEQKMAEIRPKEDKKADSTRPQQLPVEQWARHGVPGGREIPRGSLVGLRKGPGTISNNDPESRSGADREEASDLSQVTSSLC